MQNREILFDTEALKRVQAGMDEVADAVKITLGPRGRNVILDANPGYQPPRIVNDGVTIAREVQPNGSFEQTGAKIIKLAAEHTNDSAGDGTTTATILTQAIVKHGLQQIANGADPVQLRRDIEATAEVLLKALKEQAVPTDDLRSLTSVATISCGNPELGKTVAEVVHKLGVDGVITLQDGEVEDTTYELSEGLELRGGIQLPIFITHPARQLAQLDKVPVFVTDHDLTNGIETMKLMEAAGSAGHKAAVVIANSISGEAMATAVVNRAQGKFNLVPIRVQAWGETGQDLLRDVAAVTGARFFAKEEGARLPSNIQEHYDINDFGHAARIIATKERTTIIGGAGDREARIEEVEAQLPNIKVAFKKEQVKERIARLKSGVGVITVGGPSEQVREERKLRVEDAINAAKAALDLGIVPGGGSALYRAAAAAQSGPGTESPGEAAVLRAAMAPIRQMGINSGIEVSRYDLAKIAGDPRLTIDFTTGEIADGIKKGIIDPVKVVTSALKNSSYFAAQFLSSGAAIVGEQPPAPPQ
jgi:chaperonin GroEL